MTEQKRIQCDRCLSLFDSPANYITEVLIPSKSQGDCKHLCSNCMTVIDEAILLSEVYDKFHRELTNTSKGEFWETDDILINVRMKKEAGLIGEENKGKLSH